MILYGIPRERRIVSRTSEGLRSLVWILGQRYSEEIAIHNKGLDRPRKDDILKMEI